MNVRFERDGKDLVLVYKTDSSYEGISQRLLYGQRVYIKKTFRVEQKDWLDYEDVRYINPIADVDDYLSGEYRFVVGRIGNEYTSLLSSVMETTNNFFFSNDIKLERKLFIANRDISILRKIDRIINHDMYIGGEWEKRDGIPYQAYIEMINEFPTSTELTKYADSRVANVLKEYFPESDKYEDIYNKYLDRHSDVHRRVTSTSNLKIELAQFATALDDIKDMMESNSLEKDWQIKVQDVLLLLFPKYILSTREIRFPGIDGKDKQPDYILVDSNGYIDIMEIKSPDCRILSKQASYRNNYVPRREFVGAVQQIEKYRHCLMFCEKSREKVFKELRSKLPDSVELDAVNPQGIILLGRSKDFDKQQKRDFELIKRQYKNIVDIMTYDDLEKRLENIVNALKMRIEGTKQKTIEEKDG